MSIARKLAVAALVVAFASSVAAVASALTVEELIAKHFAAIGGVEKFTSIQTIKASGKVQVGGGMELPFSMTQKRPNKMHSDSEFQGAKFVFAYDGEHGWMINPMMGSLDPQPMPPMQENMFKVQADIDGPLVNSQQKGYKLELLPDDEVEGTAVHRLRVETGFDAILTLCFDKESLLLIKQITKLKQDETEIEQETYFSDYKEFAGRLMPTSMEQRVNGQTQSTLLTETMVFDEAVDDALFAMPEAAPAPAAGEQDK